jgi:predicted unusual protein kinase regulating ubiquinone biosynthesis (AarF/ABC1/UbiB family)
MSDGVHPRESVAEAAPAAAPASMPSDAPPLSSRVTPPAPAAHPAPPRRSSAPPPASSRRVPTYTGVGPVGPVPPLSAEPASRRGQLVVRPPARRRLASQRFRFVRAYTTTFVVIGSYLTFAALGRLLGQTWTANHEAEVHARNARRVELTIVRLQGLFIKVGQLLSIMANFLPQAFRSGLEGLQDQVPPRPYHEIAERIEEELGAPIAALFERFGEQPLASASLGQVHEAWLRADVNGPAQHVAVKVQHRDIDEIVRLDLLTIRRIMGIVSIFVPVQGLDAYYHQIRSMISEEVDFLREANNIDRIADNFTKQPDVRFPRPVKRLCTRRVMVTGYVEGVKVGDVAELDARGVDRRELARKIVKVFCQQIFIDGVYHADPHPGNMLVGPDGELVLLDFGAVAELSNEMREGIPAFLEAVIRRDTEEIIKALRKMGFLARTADADVSEKVIEFFHQRFQDEVKLDTLNLKDIKIDPQKGIESLIDLRKMNIGLKELSGAFHVPRDFVLLERTLLLLTGVCTQLDADMNPMEVVRPYLQDFVLGNRDWAQIALDAVKDMALKAITIPDDLRKYLNRANRGEAEIRVRGLGEAARLVYAGVRQAIYAAAGIAAGVAALELYLAEKPALSRYCLYGALGCLVLFVGSSALAPRQK